MAALIWATYAACLGAIFGNRFKDDHTVAFLLAFGAALSITIIIEVVRHVRGRGEERRTGRGRRPPRCPDRPDPRHTLSAMLAVIPVRDGVLPAGADETVAECGGRALLAGSAPRRRRARRDRQRRPARRARAVRAGPLGRRPRRSRRRRRRRAARRRPTAATSPPGSPTALGRPLLAGAIAVTPTHGPARPRRRSRAPRRPDRRPRRRHPAAGRPGRRPSEGPAHPSVRRPSAPRPSDAGKRSDGCDGARGAAARRRDDGPRRGGADLRRRRRARRAGAVRPARRASAAALGAATGATRVVTDRGWVGHDRQIGTTGVVVDPELYLAFGISGAVQHTAGLGDPDHIVSVNTDPHCPMMQMADLAVVSDANAVLDELASRRRLRCADAGRLRRHRRRRRAGRLVRRHRARPRRAAGPPPRAGPVPRQQEHVRRRGLPAHPRRAPSARGGRKRRSSAGSPAARRWCSPTTQALTVDFRTAAWGQPPYNGATAYRPDFDHWLAGKAEADGADAALLHHRHRPAARAGRPGGRRAHRPARRRRPRRRRDRLRRGQQLLRQGGRPLRTGRRRRTTRSASRRRSPCPKEVIDERFGVRGRDGVDIEIIGGTGGVNGGGFLYTNLDTVAVGVVLELPQAGRAAAPARRRSSPTSRPTRRSHRWSRAARSRSTRPT